jgi:hypothetical protein
LLPSSCVPQNPENELLSQYDGLPKIPSQPLLASWGKSLPGSPLPVSLGVPQKRVRGAAQVRTDELLGTLMGKQKGNNTAKVLDPSQSLLRSGFCSTFFRALPAALAKELTEGHLKHCR